MPKFTIHINKLEKIIAVERLMLTIERLFITMNNKHMYWTDIVKIFNNGDEESFILDNIEELCNIVYTTPELGFRFHYDSIQANLIMEHFDYDIDYIKLLTRGIENIKISLISRG